MLPSSSGQQIFNFKKKMGGKNTMATNPPAGDGHRNGAVRKRSQFKGPNGKWIKRDTDTGRIMDRKADNKPFKGVRKEN